MNRPTLFNSFWRGDRSWTVSAVSFVIFPNSVLSPVAITMAFPTPWVIIVPVNTVFLCSIFGRYLPLRVTDSFLTGFDSPVRIDSSDSN